MTARIKRKLLYLGFVLLTLVVPYAMMISDPHIETSRSLCPFKLLTGIPCPSCGITKSIIACYQGDLVKSLTYHIFGPIVIAFCLMAFVVLSVEIFSKKEYFNKIIYNSKLAYILGFVLISYHIIRMVSFFAHNDWMAIMKASIWSSLWT